MRAMKIRSKTREGNKFSLEIEEEYQNFEEALQKTLVEAGQEVKIPGFRPGKAPKEMLEKVLDRQALESRAAQILISKLYPKVIESSEIEPVDYPNVEIVQMEKDKPFVFKVMVDVYPEVKLGKYKGLKAEKKAVQVTDEDIEKVLKSLQERTASPALDDEFAKKVSKFNTLSELKEEVRAAMQKEREVEAESEMKDKLVAAASAEAKLEVPNGMVEREIDVMLDELRNSLSQSGLTLEDYLKGIKKEEKTLREELKSSAEIRVKGKVVLKAVALAEKLPVSEEELKKEIWGIAQASGEEEGALAKRLDADAKKYIEDYLLRRKALDFILEKAKIESLK